MLLVLISRVRKWFKWWIAHTESALPGIVSVQPGRYITHTRTAAHARVHKHTQRTLRHGRISHGERCMWRWGEWDVRQLRAQSWPIRRENMHCAARTGFDRYTRTDCMLLDRRYATRGWFKQSEFTKYILEKLIRYFGCIHGELSDHLVSVLIRDPFIQHHLQHASVLSCSLLFIYFQLHSQTRGLVQTLKCVHTVLCTRTHLHTHTQARHLFYFEFGMLFRRFFSVIFSVIIFCVFLKNLLFQLTRCIPSRQGCSFNIHIKITDTLICSLSLQSLTPLSFFFSPLPQSHRLCISCAPSLSVLSVLMALSVCAERSIS